MVDLSGNNLTEFPWLLFTDLSVSNEFLRKNLSLNLFHILRLKLFKKYLAEETAKRRSRKSSAVKRSQGYSNSHATKLVNSAEKLDLQQLWHFINGNLNLNVTYFNDKIDEILLNNSLTICKQSNNSTNINNSHAIVDNTNSSADNATDTEDNSNSVDSDTNTGNLDDSSDKNVLSNQLENNVEDEFFKFEEMERFVDEDYIEDEEIDYFDSLGEESDNSTPACDMMFSDFFDNPSSNTNTSVNMPNSNNIDDQDESDEFYESDESELDVEDDKVYRDDIDLTSMYDIDQDNSQDDTNLPKEADGVKNSIDEIEKELVKEKDWSMMGEAWGYSRPRNSLLSLDLQLPYYNSTLQNTTNTNTDNTTDTVDNTSPLDKVDMEIIIMERIKSGIFDNIEYKRDFHAEESKPDQVEELDFSKDKRGLGEIYEDKYKELFSSNNSKLDTQKQLLTEMFSKLIYKLDSLSNSTFIPKIPKSTTNSISTISVETPINVIISENNVVNSSNTATPKGNKVNLVSTGSSRNRKKRKYKSRMKRLVKSGKMTVKDVEMLNKKMREANKQRREDLKNKKLTGLTGKDLKSKTRINTTQLLNNISQN
ncbi:uncharacterized protein TA19190 [Theileria annulata]|uniref:Mpp10 protein n=1 Tax=Theileria annulata TaxID=5874 RepID=Q4UGB3_THEAN|nr:uncharacterized protein TA19190 [Theileria annulata]CAI73876.1 hypothetical protein TA19190 [Theileria annulata]|eukprot:XP_954553.1 hypothetical protein TA19190 [Theileria annulata]